MNAYELTDKLKLFWHTENDNLFENTATMLRQQADRIVALEQKHKDAFEYIEKLLKERDL
jgi:hypothetical protein